MVGLSVVGVVYSIICLLLSAQNEAVSLADQRRLFRDRWGEVCAVPQAA